MNMADTTSRPELDDSPIMSSSQAQALVRLLEAAPHVKRRYHFFVWMQTHVHLLLPHVLVVCGAYQRQRRELVFDTFHSVQLPPALMAALADSESALMSGLSRCWIEGGGRACTLALGSGPEAAADTVLRADCTLLREAGLGHLSIHGVARPQRPSEIESLFVLAGPEPVAPALRTAHLDLLIAHLHATYLRVQSVEREMSLPPRPVAAVAAADEQRSPITARERQVLQGVREGKSNQQISEVLGISPLTVKNHIQKILRKLGAHNRAQAVAMTTGLVPSAPLAARDRGP